MRRFLVLALATIGFAFAGWTMVEADRVAPGPKESAEMPAVPFTTFVAGTGITEASTGNIAIGTPVSGIVTDIRVKRGEEVKAGAPLFTIDERQLDSTLPPAEAAVAQAAADYEKADNLLNVGSGLAVGSSISRIDLENRRFDVSIKKAALDAAKAKVAQIKSEIALHTIRAPLDGTVLQINTRLGEFAASGVLAQPLIVFGDDRTLYLRVSVDQEDAWRVSPGARAIAYVRGNPALSTRLTFVRFDPYLVPKTLLSGSSSERMDTRVLDVIYSFPHKNLPIFVGQEMDAFIEAPPAGARLSSTEHITAR